MNLGIVIAVSDYGSLGNNLPGCKIDGQAIAKILEIDNKFDDVLIITDETHSGNVKPELISFISKHKDNEIQDVVFYFTGHGDFSGDEFYYLLGDYDRKRRKQTSLENTELDNLLKTLNPSNAIKIVDACHSGTPYIKDPDAFDTYLKGTKGEFRKCYFMFSSQTDQYSYQDDHLSFFTKSIVESVYKHSSTTIRYKDIIDYVSDSFSENHSQTPFFIVQADFTEPFCTLSEPLKNSLGEVLKGPAIPVKIEVPEDKGRKTLIELVKADAKRFCSEEDGLKYLTNFIKKVSETKLSNEISDLYNIECKSMSDYSEIPFPSAIGKWLDSNENNFFAIPFKEEKKIKRRVHKDPKKRLLGSFNSWSVLGIEDEDDYKYVVNTEMFITGFRSTVDLPLNLLKVTLEPKFPNIDPASAYIVPILSKTDLRVFFSFNFYDQKGWDSKKISGSVKWLTEIVGLADEEAHTELGKKIMEEYSQFIYAPLAEKFDLLESSEEDDTEENKGETTLTKPIKK